MALSSDKEQQSEIKTENGNANEMSFECHICLKVFFSKTMLMRHKVTHCGVKTFSYKIYEKSLGNDMSVENGTRCEALMVENCPRQKFITQDDTVNFHNDENDIGNHFECSTCEKSFYNKGDLLIHKGLHDTAQMDKCENHILCNHDTEVISECEISQELYSSIDSCDTKTGNSRNSDEKMFQCSLCELRFTNKSSCKKHTREHKGTPWTCNICSKSFTEKLGLKRHIMIHTGEKPFECELCQKRFAFKGKLLIHKRMHFGVKPYECTVCHRTFSQRGGLNAHMMLHSGEKPFECTVCKKQFRQKGNLKEHMELHVHSGKMPFECEICHRRFATKLNMQRHRKRIHSFEESECKMCEKPIYLCEHSTVLLADSWSDICRKRKECEICGKKFAHRAGLLRHIKAHSGKKPYVCKFCNQAFSVNGNLKIHLRRHTGEKPYECEICLQSFSAKSSLAQHRDSHFGLKPHNCELCSKTFTRKTTLTRHMKTVHCFERE